jgi:uncharacterized protein YigA (DUF484 family)
MNDDLRHNMNLVIPGLNFWGDQNDAAKSVVDKTKWVMETAINRIEKLEENIELQLEWYLSNKRVLDGRIAKLEAALHRITDLTECWENDLVSQVNEVARKALEGKDDPQTNL